MTLPADQQRFIDAFQANCAAFSAALSVALYIDNAPDSATLESATLAKYALSVEYAKLIKKLGAVPGTLGGTSVFLLSAGDYDAEAEGPQLLRAAILGRTLPHGLHVDSLELVPSMKPGL